MTESKLAAEAAPVVTPQKDDKSNNDLEGIAVSVVRKNRAFKRIRGFLSGESRRERRARKAAAKKKKKSSGNVSDDDQETIFDVNVEERSVVSRLTDASGKAEGLLGASANVDDEGYLLKVVLLLMDPKTRRFELLQLEFDSLKALVSDVLAQIPISVTEQALRSQSYTGICGRAGKEMPPEKLLATFCQGNEVLVAIPAGVEAMECARLARPILSDSKVMQMLRSSGIDTSNWKDDAPALQKSVPPMSTNNNTEPDLSVSPTDSASNMSLWIFLVILIGLGLQMFHLYISAPIDPDHVVSPGTWLSKCGLFAFMPSCEKNAYLQVDMEGKVTLFDENREMAWQMTGAVCPVDDTECIPGMQVTNEGKIYVGGKQVHYVIVYKENEAELLTPWPFEEKPQLRIWKKP